MSFSVSARRPCGWRRWAFAEYSGQMGLEDIRTRLTANGKEGYRFLYRALEDVEMRLEISMFVAVWIQWLLLRTSVSLTSGSKDLQQVEVRHVYPLATAVCQVYCNEQHCSVLFYWRMEFIKNCVCKCRGRDVGFNWVWHYINSPWSNLLKITDSSRGVTFSYFWIFRLSSDKGLMLLF